MGKTNGAAALAALLFSLQLCRVSGFASLVDCNFQSEKDSPGTFIINTNLDRMGGTPNFKTDQSVISSVTKTGSDTYSIELISERELAVFADVAGTFDGTTVSNDGSCTNTALGTETSVGVSVVTLTAPAGTDEIVISACTAPSQVKLDCEQAKVSNGGDNIDLGISLEVFITDPPVGAPTAPPTAPAENLSPENTLVVLTAVSCIIGLGLFLGQKYKSTKM